MEDIEMKKFLAVFSSILLLAGLSAAADHLLITEFCVTPTDGEFFEIYNPTGSTVSLTNYYIAEYIYKNDNDYVNIVDGSDSGNYQDFLAKFPDGASIDPGVYQVVSMKDDSVFTSVYTGVVPDYELIDDSGGADLVPDMVSAGAGGIGSSPGLTNSGESLMLFYWDGTTDLLQDVDYVVWGDKDEAIDKTGVEKDGPDADEIGTTYLSDTAVADQTVVNADNDGDDYPHNDDQSAQRSIMDEVGETLSGGNGITGHDETSEDLSFEGGVWNLSSTPTPQEAPVIDTEPAIFGVGYLPCSPVEDEPTAVQAYITDDEGIVLAETYYSTDGGFSYTSIEMTYIGDDKYMVEIPGQSAGTQVDFYVFTVDTYGYEVRNPSSSDYSYMVDTFTLIYDVQSDTTTGGDSNYMGTPVNVTGYVTAGSGVFGDNFFYISDSQTAAPWEGIKVYSYYSNPPVLEGDLVSVAGIVDEYYGETEVNANNTVGDSTNCITLLDEGFELYPYGILTGDLPGNEELEGVLVSTSSAEVTLEMDEYGEWLIDDGSGDCMVDDLAGYLYVPVLGDLLNVQGIAVYSWGSFKIEQRGDDDIEELGGLPDVTITNIDPPSVVQAGTSTSWTVEASNNSGETQVVDVWLEIEYPVDGNLVMVIGKNITLPAGFTGQGEISVNVPGSAPEMTVFVDTTIGVHPDTPYDSDGFYCDVIH